ncbi:hypothetical protein PK98_04445 [Croceibacterium mercuriale]|uniref:J domain-containing protein n=1 Tax=Croceibacterium mercuriale TaxID=1572751 RepID=A0A0B2C1K7_9SPHN|nr:J domain-containing protein [Croceibacterium mercuriale]KHL25856.1 hypothetical protein PK98_04445 [Croceibacterium mercuriale]
MMQAPSPTDWTVLGLAPTGDRDAVRAAYRTRLRDMGPDKDPEGFQTLRQAYEAVLASLETDGDEAGDGAPSAEVIAFLDELAAHRAAGDAAGAITLIDATIARHPPGSATLVALEDAVLHVVAFSEPLAPGLFRHLADRFDWRDMGGHAARSDPERHAALLDRIAAEDWFRRLRVTGSDATGRVEQLLLLNGREVLSALSDRALSEEERQRVRTLFDELLEHGGYLLPRFDGEALAVLREAVEGPPLLGDAIAATATPPLAVAPSRVAAPARAMPADTGMPPANRKLTLLVIIVAIIAMGAIKMGIDHFRSAPDAATTTDDAPAEADAIRAIKDPATPWLVTRQEPDGIYVDWSPMVTLRNGLAEIRIGAETPQPTTAMPVPTMPMQLGFVAPPSLTYMTMRVQTRDGAWSEIRRYSLTKAAP